MADGSVPAARSSSSVIQLAPRSVCSDTVEALGELLAQAKAGRIIGLAYVALYQRQQYSVNTAGELNQKAALARGMVAALDDELAKRVGVR